MGYALINSTGKEMKISKKAAEEFFGNNADTKKFLCLPFSGMGEASENTVTKIYEVREYRRKRKIPGTCVIRMGGIGDLIMLSSGLRELGRRGEKVTLATLPQHLDLARLMKIGNVISIEELGRFKFDRMIDLRFAVEPKEMGSICKGNWQEYTTEDRSDLFDKLLAVYPAKKDFAIPFEPVADRGYVVINASMVAAARNIIPKYIPPLCKLLLSIRQRVILIGQSQPWNKKLADFEMEGVSNLIDRSTPFEMVNAIAHAALVITPDTGTLHIAAALGKKTLALFGNINPRTRISYYPTVRALYPQGELPCIPCWDMHTCMSGRPEDGSKCMQSFTPEKIFRAIKELGGA